MAVYYYTVQTVVFLSLGSKALVLYVNSYTIVPYFPTGATPSDGIFGVLLTTTDSKVLNGGEIAGRINPTSKHSGPHSWRGSPEDLSEAPYRTPESSS